VPLKLSIWAVEIRLMPFARWLILIAQLFASSGGVCVWRWGAAAGFNTDLVYNVAIPQPRAAVEHLRQPHRD